MRVEPNLGNNSLDSIALMEKRLKDLQVRRRELIANMKEASDSVKVELISQLSEINQESRMLTVNLRKLKGER